MRRLQFAPDSAQHQPLFAPVELNRFSQLELQRYEGARGHLRRSPLRPGADEIRQHRVAAAITLRLELGVQRLGATSIALSTPSVGFSSAQKMSRRVKHPGQFSTRTYRLWRSLVAARPECLRT